MRARVPCCATSLHDELTAGHAGRFPYAAASRATHFWELLECIAEQTPPTLADAAAGAAADANAAVGAFSDPFHDFVDACLRKDPAERPSAEALAQHAWLAPPPGRSAEEEEEAEAALLAELVAAGAAAKRAAAPLPPLREELL